MSDASEVVLAFPREVIDTYLTEGFSTMVSPERLAELVKGREVWKERSVLKAEKDDQQVLPYEAYILINADPLVPDLISLYRRGKTVGEELLMGNYSIGYGGHVNKKLDARYDSAGTLDTQATIAANIQREKDEEVTLTPIDGHTVRSVSEHIGFINDNSNDIGKSHFAYVSVRRLPFGTSVISNEPNQVIQGAFTLRELLTSNYVFENWSKFLLNELAKSFNAAGKYVPLADLQAISDASA